MLIHCTRCSGSLPVSVIKSGDAATCPNCGASLIVRPFPALLALRPTVHPDDLRLEAGEASCFYHVNKRASSTCGRCGRFVCSLCTVEFDSAIWCPGCMADAQAGKKHAGLENRRVLWDSIALGTATFPFFMGIWPAAPGSLAAIFISLRYWRSPGSLIPRMKWRFVLAILIALAEITFMAFVVYSLVQARQARQ
jgi:DNA-directed RNA polymerase subunit RPC12/RpoP